MSRWRSWAFVGVIAIVVIMWYAMLMASAVIYHAVLTVVRFPRLLRRHTRHA